MTNFFIGIDFSKGTFDATVMERDRLDGKGVHAVFENSAAGARKLVEWVLEQTHPGSQEEVLFCGEDTGLYSKIVSDALARDGWFMWLDSALRIKRSTGISRGKNDKKDSRDIAIYAARFQDKRRRHVAPDELTEAVRALFMKRKFLVEQRDALRRRSKEMKPVLKGNRMLQRTFRSDDRLDAAYCKETKEQFIGAFGCDSTHLVATRSDIFMYFGNEIFLPFLQSSEHINAVNVTDYGIFFCTDEALYQLYGDNEALILSTDGFTNILYDGTNIYLTAPDGYIYLLAPE